MINPDIADVYKEMEARLDATRLLVSMHAHEYQLVREFLRSLGRPDSYQGTYPDLGYTDGSLKGIIIQVHLEKQESFKAGTPIIEWLLSRGFEQQGNDEDADWGYRQVNFVKTEQNPPLFWPSHHEWKPYRLTATVRMWPHPDGQLCEKVVTGQEPTYKFVCKDV